jgi:geranylgeranyl reductase family protein
MRATGDTRREWEVLIVGGGPAGSAAAIQLAARNAALAADTLLLDRATFPRVKLCGGGVIPRADQLLESLGVRVDVPSVRIHAVRFEHAGGRTEHRGRDLFRVVRREEFDHALLRVAELRGVSVRQGVSVLGMERTPRGVAIRTTSGTFHARVVIGADGARSVVRRHLVGSAAGLRFVALETLTPEDASIAPEFVEHRAVFDFREVPNGLRGYAWDFPSVKDGRATMNRGMGGVRWPSQRSLKRTFDDRLGSCGASASSSVVEGATLPLYHPTSLQSSERVVLAGDAVGVDPVTGEGISIAIGTGMLAAHATADAFETGDFTFADHNSRIGKSSIGVALRRSWLTAGTFYHRLRAAEPPAFPAGGFA